MGTLDRAKVGDKLIISDGSIETVTRLTKTLVIVGKENAIGKTYEYRYKKTSGWPPGDWGFGGTYARLPKDENELADLQELRRLRAMINRVNDYDFRKLSVSDIETIVGMINAREQ